MTTTMADTATPTGARIRAVASQPVSLRRAVKSEWIKFRSLRSSWAVLGAAILGMLIVALIVAYNTRHITGNQDANDLAPSATLQGYYLGQLLIGALGVMFVSSEFSTGMIRSTFATAPKRIPVLWSKLVVFFTVTLVAMVPISVLSFLASQAVISHYRAGFSITDPGVWRAAVGTGVYLALLGVLGGMIAWVVRSTPGSLVTYFAIVLVLPVFGELFGSAGKHVAQFLPSQAGAAFITSLPESPHLSPAVGALVLLVWIAAAAAIAAISLGRRDA